MATTAAERQAAYRRRRAEGAGDKRLNTWISADASHALDHLTRVKSMTRRSILEDLILAAAAEHTPDAAATEHTPDAAEDKPNASPSSDMERLEELGRARRARVGLLAQAIVAIRNAKDEDSDEAALKNTRQLVRESRQALAEERKLIRRITQNLSAQKRAKENSHE